MLEFLSGISVWRDAALLVGLSVTRIAVAFLLLPVFAPDIVPAMARNALLVVLSCVALALQPAISPGDWPAMHWLALFLKEAALGGVLGFGLASFLWAFSAAGQIVDTKVGGSNLQINDPTSGEQASVSATLLGRLAGLLFMSGGGFSLFLNLLLQSFRAWPVGALSVMPKVSSLLAFEASLGRLMTMALLIATPALVVMFVLDLVLGLVNRYAPQLNVSSIAAPLKGLASIALWMLVMVAVANGFDGAVGSLIAGVLPQWKPLLEGS
jgi:type III secretion protein T